MTSILTPILRLLSVLCLLGAAVGARAERTVSVPLADGFEIPVGKPPGEGYYVYRGFAPHGHLGEDWNGNGKGNSDLGDPVYATADGIVVFSADVRLGWGNVVIVRHVYRAHDGGVRQVDSLYGHLDRRDVRKDQIVKRGQQVGTIGTAHGKYVAHLHFEMRKNLLVGMNRSQFSRDFSTYYSPRQFIAEHRQLQAGRNHTITVDTFGAYPPGDQKQKREIPTRETIDRKNDKNDLEGKIDKLIKDNKKKLESLTDEDVDGFWNRLKGRLKDAKSDSSGAVKSRP